MYASCRTREQNFRSTEHSDYRAFYKSVVTKYHLPRSYQGRSQWGGEVLKIRKGRKHLKGKKGKGKEKEEKKERKEKEKGKERKKEKGKEKGRKKWRGKKRGKRREREKSKGKKGAVLREMCTLIMTRILPRSIHQIARIHYKNSKSFPLLRGHIPSDTPWARRATLVLMRHWGTSPILSPDCVRPGYTLAGSYIYLNSVLQEYCKFLATLCFIWFICFTIFDKSTLGQVKK